MPDYDVAIIGGGPSGSTISSYLRIHDPSLKILVLERENFPRDHIGESQLPVISEILDEIGVWDKVEAADFPIKIGATYRWGKTKELWDFDFLPPKQFKDEERPAKYVGQRKATAFQVDRAIYDKILLDHAKELGTEVREGTRVTDVLKEGDKITGLKLEDGSVVTARYYVDASGNVGLIRRAMGVESVEPVSLRNVAFYDYWQNAKWAVHIGVGGTRIHIRSLGYGWIWFIPLGPTRTSVGLVCPVEYYKKSGMRPEELYRKALSEDPKVTDLMMEATCENKFTTTKDWSFYADRMTGENWFLLGEAAGFADPILSAGLTISHVGAKELAFTLLELDRGDEDPEWLREEYTTRTNKRVAQHIRFANYWYTANEEFTDLIEYTSEIAKHSGLHLSGKEAWQWLGTGGFTDIESGVAGFSFGAAKQISKLLDDSNSEWILSKNNIFDLDLSKAEVVERAVYKDGKVLRLRGWLRDGSFLPDEGVNKFLVQTLGKERLMPRILAATKQRLATSPNRKAQMFFMLQALESLIQDRWVKPSFDPNIPLFELETPEENDYIHFNRDEAFANA
jgi:flavin-dependent dehydrogenase